MLYVKMGGYDPAKIDQIEEFLGGFCMFKKIISLIMSIIMLLTGVSFGDIVGTVIDAVEGVIPETEIVESEKEKEFEVSTAATSGKISTGCDYNYSYTTPEIISGDINFKNLTDGSLASTTPGGVGWTKVTLKNDTQNTSADGTPVTIALFDDSVPHFYVQLDLGFIQEVDYITMDFANDTSCARPTKVEVMLSEDGYNYDIYKAQSFTTVTSGSHTRYKVTFNEDVKAKAIKYIVYGNENDVMYIDELEIYGQKLNDTVLLSQGASYTWTGTAAGGNYNGHAPATQLTDGVLSEMAESSYSTFDNKFILKATSNNVGEDGFYGQDIVLDLGKTQNVSKTKINGLYRSNGNGGYWDMDFVVFKYSTDGVNYKNFGTAFANAVGYHEGQPLLARKIYSVSRNHTVKARYIKACLYSRYHIGMDEIQIYGSDKEIADNFVPSSNRADRLEYTNVLAGKAVYKDGAVQSLLTDELYTDSTAYTDSTVVLMGDLGQQYDELCGYNIYFKTKPKNIRMYLSYDNVNWNLVSDRAEYYTLAGYTNAKAYFNYKEGRYFKFEIDRDASSGNIAVAEIQIFNKQPHIPLMSGGFFAVYPEEATGYNINILSPNTEKMTEYDWEMQLRGLYNLGQETIVLGPNVYHDVKKSVMPIPEGSNLYNMGYRQRERLVTKDLFETILTIADKLGMKVYLGTIATYSYPDVHQGITGQTPVEHYTDVAQDGCHVIRRMEYAYGHHSSFEGYYFTDETCDYYLANYNGALAAFRTLYLTQSKEIRLVSPDKKIMIAPAIWRTSNLTASAENIYNLIKPEPGSTKPMVDVVAAQDCLGRLRSLVVPDNIYNEFEKNAQVWANAVRSAGAEFWYDAEIFEPTYKLKRYSELVKSFETEAKTSNKIINFSYERFIPTISGGADSFSRFLTESYRTEYAKRYTSYIDALNIGTFANSYPEEDYSSKFGRNTFLKTNVQPNMDGTIINEQWPAFTPFGSMAANENSRYAMMWDDTYIYFGVKTNDKTYSEHTNNDTFTYAEDFLIVQFGLPGASGEAGVAENTWRIGVAKHNVRGVEDWVKIGGSYVDAGDNVIAKFDDTNPNGRTAIVAVKWSYLGIAPQAGITFPISLVYCQDLSAWQTLNGNKQSILSGFLNFTTAEEPGYTVTFDGNGGTCNETKIVYRNGTYGKMPTPTRDPYRYGHDFDGWFTAAEGGTRITEETIVNITANQTLYAHWVLRKFKVQFYNMVGTDTNNANLNSFYLDGSEKEVNGITYTYKPSTGIITLNGTATSSVEFFEIPFVFNGTDVSGYTITDEIKGGSITNGSVFVDISDSKGNNYRHNVGSTGQMWSLLFDEFDVNTLRFGVHMDSGSSAKPVTLNNYQIRITLNNSTVAKPYEPVGMLLYWESSNGGYGELPTVPARTGYTFDGWYSHLNGKETKAENGQTLHTNGNHNLFTYWIPNTYTINFDANSGTNISGSTASMSMTYDTAKNLTANGFTKTGHDFTGWNTAKDGTGTSYTNEQSVKNLTATNGGTVTLYAQWTAKVYTVNFNANGGSGAPEAQSRAYATPALTLSSTVPTREGYTFTGWNTASDGSGTSYNPGGSYGENKSVTLYAQWTANNDDVWDGETVTEPKFDAITNTYYIYTASELAWVSQQVKSSTSNKFSGCTLKLMDDIYLGGHNFTPIGGRSNSGASVNNYFSGIFDGQGHKIYGLYIDSTVAYTGLFGYVNGATIKNFGLISPVISGTDKNTDLGVGGVIGRANNAEVSNVFLRDPQITGDYRVGGIIGYAFSTGSAVTNCYVQGGTIKSTASTTNTDASAGGILGCARVKCNISNCYSTAVCTENNDAADYTGAIAGYFAVTATTISNSYGENDDDLYGTTNYPPVTDGISAIVKADTLKTYASTLGEAYTNDVADINAGYPIFVWEESEYSLRKLYNQELDSYRNEEKYPDIVEMIIEGLTAEGKLEYWVEYLTAMESAKAILDSEILEDTVVVQAAYDKLEQTIENLIDVCRETDSIIFPWDGVTITEPEKDGTKYYIYTAEELAWVAYRVAQSDDYSFVGEELYLMKNINLGDKEWLPIGGYRGNNYNGGDQFKGLFDGQGHIVSNYKITESRLVAGLFGYTNGATIKEIGVEKFEISHDALAQQDQYGTGALIGIATASTTVDACFARDGLVSATKSYYVGGLVGNSNTSILTVSNCYVQDVTVENKYANTGSTEPTAGGIVGHINNKSAEIKNCYVAATVSNANSNVKLGAVAGCLDANQAIDKCYAANDITDNKATQIIGTASHDDVILKSMFTSGMMESADLKKASGKLGDSFLCSLNEEYNNGFPILYWEDPEYVLNKVYKEELLSERTLYADILEERCPEEYQKYKEAMADAKAESINGEVADKAVLENVVSALNEAIENLKNAYGILEEAVIPWDGTVSEPLSEQSGSGKVYYIYTAEELAWMAVHSTLAVSASYRFTNDTIKLMKNIDLGGKEWLPIGGYYLNRANDSCVFQLNNSYSFNGLFEGQGHIVSNYKITASWERAGLFGHTSGATIKELGVEKFEITNGIADTNTIYGTGALIGQIGASTVDACFARDGSISASASRCVGGLVGTNGSTTSFNISNCYVQNVTLENSNSKTVSIGGIIGYVYHSATNAELTNCYAVVKCTSSNTSASLGAIIGDFEKGTVSNCFAANDVAGNAATNLIGAGSGTVQSSEMLSSGSLKNTVTDPVISDVFVTNDNPNYNDAYPVLYWEKPEGDIPVWEREYIVSFDANGGTVGTDYVKATYGSALPNITVPTKTGYTFDGYFADNKTTTLTSTVSVKGSAQTTKRVDFNANGNGWNLTTEGDKGRHLTAVITVVDSTLTTAPRIQFNDQNLDASMYKVEAITNGWKYTVDFNITEAMVTAYENIAYDTYYRFIDFEGVTEKSEVKVSSATLGGNMYYGADGKGVRVSDFTANDTLYARWTANTYTVTFNANGGECDTESKTVTFAGTYGELPTPTREGYTFAGWYTSESGGTQVTASTTVSTTATHTLYAQWTANTYTVTFDANGGNVGQKNKTVTYDGIYNTLPTPTREGYTFAGWFTEASGGTQILATTTVKITATQTLYAHWLANERILSVDSNGGLNTRNLIYYPGATAPSSSFSGGEDSTISYNVTLGSDGTVNIGGKYTGGVVERHTYTDMPLWVYLEHGMTYQYSYTSTNQITAFYFFPNGRVENFVSITEKTAKVVDNGDGTYTYSGTFICGGKGDIKDGDTGSDGTIVGGWSNVADATAFYQLRIDQNCGINSPAEVVSYSVTDLSIKEVSPEATSKYKQSANTTIAITPPKKAGHEFAGWYTEAQGGTLVSNSEEIVIDSTKTVYAHWEVKEGTLSVDTNGGLNTRNLIYYPGATATSSSFSGGDDSTISYNATIASDGTIKISGNSTSHLGGERYTIIPLWVYLEHGMTYQYSYTSTNERTEFFLFPNGVVKNYVSISAETTEVVANGDGTYTYSGTFVCGGEGDIRNGNVSGTASGWNVLEDATGFYQLRLDQNRNPNAVPEVKSYSITDLYIKEVSPNATSKYKQAKNTTIGIPNPVREGYIFDGWYTEAQGGTLISKSTEVEITGDHTLYAQWTANTYTVTFNANGGTGAPSEQTKTYGTDLTLSSTVPTREGYTFTGWNTAQDGSGTSYAAGASYTANAEVTLYAQWTANKYKVLFDTNDGNNRVNHFILESRTKTVDGITYTYDPSTNILTLNGTAPTDKDHYTLSDVPFTVVSGERYWVSLVPVSGSISYGGALVLELYERDGSNRLFSDLPGNNINKELVVTDSLAGTVNRMELYGWYDTNKGTPLTFKDYKVKITVEKNPILSGDAPAGLYLANGSPYGELPTPTREGFKFAGWYTAPSGGEKVTAETIVSTASDHTLYAHWSSDDKYSVSFDTNDGNNVNLFYVESLTKTVGGITYTYDPSTGIITIDGTAEDYRELFEVPFDFGTGSIDEYKFYDEYIGGTVSGGRLVVDIRDPAGRSYYYNVNSTSYWIERTGANLKPNTLRFWVWYDANSGSQEVTFDNYQVRIKLEKSETATEYTPIGMYAEYGSAYGELPTPTRVGYVFDGWYTEAEGGTKVTSDTVISIEGNHTLYAHWSRFKYNLSATSVGSYMTVSLNGSTTELVGYQYQTKLDAGTEVTLNAIVNEGETRDFMFWVDDRGRIVSYTPEYTFVLEADRTIKAVYSEDINSDFYTVAFVDSILKTVLDIQQVEKGDSAKIPTTVAENEGYVFDHWDTDTSAVNGNLTVNAVYRPLNKMFTITTAIGTTVKEAKYYYNTKVRIEITDSQIPDGKYFGGWLIDGSDTVASYDEVFEFYAYKDMTVTAVFVDKEVEATATVTLASSVFDVNTTEGTYKASLMVTRELPENLVLVSSGLLLTQTAEFGTADKLTFEEQSENSSAIRLYRTVHTTNDGQYQLTVKTSTSKTFYARGFVVYLDKKTGDIITLYTDVQQVNSNS